MKKNINAIILLIIIFVLGIGVGYATGVSIESKDVVYENSGTTLASSNVQNAIDEIYTKSNGGDATSSQILTGKKAIVGGNSIVGTMVNNGSLSSTINPGETYTIPAGYTSGGTIQANSNQNSATYTPTSRSNSIDMGASNTYRYLNTNSVPNSNTGTYTYAANSTGGTIDLGANNSYRYVNAANVYAKGKADGTTGQKYQIDIKIKAGNVRNEDGWTKRSTSGATLRIVVQGTTVISQTILNNGAYNHCDDYTDAWYQIKITAIESVTITAIS